MLYDKFTLKAQKDISSASTIAMSNGSQEIADIL